MSETPKPAETPTYREAQDILAADRQTGRDRLIVTTGEIIRHRAGAYYKVSKREE